MLKLILIFAFISVSLLTYSFLRYIFGRQRSISRLAKYIESQEIREEQKNTSHREYRPGMNVLAKGIRDAKFLDSYKRKIQVKLTKAHVLLKPEEYIAISIIIFFVTGSLVLAYTGSAFFAISAAVIGWIFPSIVLKSRIKKRIKALNEQLPDAINLISNSLKAGFSFFQAIDVVSKEMQGPIAQEFLILQKEVNLGLATEKALENLAFRASSDDLELVVTAVLIQRQVGGDLSLILDNICSTIRERIKIKGEVRTLTSQGRMSGILISVMPPALGIIIYLVNPEHIGVLFKNPIGIGILAYSVLMELIGIFAISKIVKIEF